MLARLFRDAAGEKGFNGDETLGGKVERWCGASGDAGSAATAGSSLHHSEGSVERLAGVKNTFTLGGLLLTVSRNATEANSALSAVDDRPCCCEPISSPLEFPASLGPVAALGNGHIIRLLNCQSKRIRERSRLGRNERVGQYLIHNVRRQSLIPCV